MSDQIVVKSNCPFCGQGIAVISRAGKCSCGAIYAVSPTPKESIRAVMDMQEGSGSCPVSVRYDGIVNFYRPERIIRRLSQAEIQMLCSDLDDFPVFLESDFQRI